MMLMVMKHGGKNFLEKMFKLKGPAFEKMILNFMKNVCPVLVSSLVKEDFRKKRQVGEEKKFENFSIFCLCNRTYITGVQ